MEAVAELHPFFVHFPIALFLFYALVESWSAFTKKEYFGNSALILLLLVVVTSVLSALTGNQAEAIISEFAGNNAYIPNELIEQHETFATLSIFYFILMLGLRFYFVAKKKFEGKIRYLFVVLALIGCVLILITGKLGGDLVFKYGVGTPYIN